MKRWRTTATIVVMFTGIGGWSALAADTLTEALLACGSEIDDARRLRCFDAVLADVRAASPTRAAAAAAPDASAPVPQTATPAASPEEKFGARGDLKRETQLNEITATVTGVKMKPYGQLVVTLDNAQVWAELAAGSKIKLKTGDAVKIERGALGSFFLVAPNGRSSKVSRVR